MLAAVNPLPLRVDLGVSLNGRHDCGGSDFHLARSFDDLLECRPHVALPFRHESKRVSMAIDACAVCQAVLLGNPYRTLPSHKGRLNLCAFLVRTDGATPLVPAQIHGLALGCLSLGHLFPSNSDAPSRRRPRTPDLP